MFGGRHHALLFPARMAITFSQISQSNTEMWGSLGPGNGGQCCAGVGVGV